MRKAKHFIARGCVFFGMLVATATFLVGCGERPANSVAVDQEGRPTRAGGRPDAKHSADSTVIDAASAKSDHQRIQGSWDFVTLVARPRQSDRIVFSGDKIFWHVGEKSLEGTFIIDATKQPKQIDLNFPGEKDDAKVMLGIYDFRSELLAICIRGSGRLRPAKLDATGDQALLLFHPSMQGSEPVIRK